MEVRGEQKKRRMAGMQVRVCVFECISMYEVRKWKGAFCLRKGLPRHAGFASLPLCSARIFCCSSINSILMPPPLPHLLDTNPPAPLPLFSTFSFLSICLAYSLLPHVALILCLLARLWLPFSLILLISLLLFHFSF